MAMRKVTRTLFHEDDDDDMVNTSLSPLEYIMHQGECNCSPAAATTNSPCCMSPPAGSSQYQRGRQRVQSQEPQGDLRLLWADVRTWLRGLQRGPTWRPYWTFQFHGKQRTQTGTVLQHKEQHWLIFGEKITPDILKGPEGPGFDYWVRAFFCGICMNSRCLCEFSSSHSPKTCKLGVRLIGHSKLSVGVNVSVDGCLSLYDSPAMNWWLVFRLVMLG